DYYYFLQLTHRREAIASALLTLTHLGAKRHAIGVAIVAAATRPEPRPFATNGRPAKKWLSPRPLTNDTGYAPNSNGSPPGRPTYKSKSTPTTRFRPRPCPDKNGC